MGLTTVNFSRRTYKRASSPTKRPVTPHISCQSFHQDHFSPLLYHSPDNDQRPLRRKPSLANLASRQQPIDGTESSSDVFVNPLLQTAAPHSFLPSLLPAFSPTPGQHPTATSPSLSSTVTTLPSTPGQTPVSPKYFDFQPPLEPEPLGWREPLRTKRKFPLVKQAKRLPQRGEVDTWEVFAAILDTGDGYRTRRDQSFRLASDWRYGGLATEDPVEIPRERLVRFTGVGSETDSGTDQGEQNFPARQQEQKRPENSSPYRYAEFKFPAPPNHTWTGSLGECLP